ncbi:Sorting nexin, cytoplasm-to-vacuole targeting pathway/endosomal sorting [Puccinia graminis f. sp. tritici]|uniref:Sorting nexin, cytoplasm-to-vacuole targeting pathway/endosomal sorting n=1 Tax=Puccinia graminis f. sp. tritici TaxID=56615 RepID=A0A5B0MU26_PUCGR|nr:Sorting nexin, cytoplasm-to-vacuole targeting pathway/endosomal sorting [Puccinia graminis f. sp. tritici]
MANSTDFDIDPFKETIYAEPSQSISSHSPPREPSPPNEAGPSSSSPTRRGSLQPTSSSPTTNFVHAYQVEHRPNPVSPSSSINNPKSPIPPIAAVTTPGRGGRPTLRDLKDVEEIKVMDAIKTSEGGSSSYIAYVIQSSRGIARHRYSEFESLRSSLVALYPVLIVPPIPDKQSLGDYAFHPSSMAKTKEDPVTVARRKRMLAVFLNRLIRHPVLGRERVLWQFLAQDVSWSEVLQQPPLTNLPKNPMKAPAHNPSDPELQALFSHLPVPSSSSVPLQDPDQRFQDSEVFTQKFSSHLTNSLEKINRRLMKRWQDYAVDQAELGGVLNGFALVEGSVVGDGQLSTQETAEATSAAIERTGQAIDATYVSTNAMLQDWECQFTEPLHEYAQFSNVIKHLLRFRHMKQAQFEMARDILDTKRLVLEDLERSETEAQRLESALNRVRQLDLERSKESSESPEANSATSHVIGSSGPALITPIRKPASTGFLGALRHSLNGITDVDPESTRRNSIGKNKDYITNLEEGLRAAAADLRYCSQTIQADLDRFQRQKVADLKDMCLAFAKLHIEISKKNLEQWEAAKENISNVVVVPSSFSDDQQQ